MLKKIIKNFILYSLSFSFSLLLYKGTIFPNENYDLYYAAFMISWAIAGLLARKYRQAKEEFWLLTRLYSYTESFFLMLGILTLLIYKFNLIGVSRFIILNSLIISFSIEIITLLYRNKNKISIKYINQIYSGKAFTFDVLIFGIINLFLIYKITGNVSFDTKNLLLFLSFYLSWFAGSFLGHQFHPAYREKNYWTFIWQYIKSYLIISALVAFSAFINRLETQNIITILSGIIFYSVLSFIGISSYYNIKKYRILALNIAGFPVKGESGDILLTTNTKGLNNNYRSAFNKYDSEVLNSKLKNLSLNKYPEVLDFLTKSVDLKSIDDSFSVILKSDNKSNIDFIPENKLQLLFNLQKINRIQNINDYLAEVNCKLINGGIFAGCFETAYLHHQHFLKRYPYYFAQLFYFFDFIWNRVFSKIFLLKMIYSALSNKTNKSFSLAEGLGRLYYSGFEVLELQIINNNMFFISKKIKEPVKDVIPSTGLIFKMKRTGKDGKPLIVYKLRTMHPYSEYLQEYIYKKFSLQEGGKFKNDFRITYWGSILRKLWLDEMPMIINWIKGDLKLVGLRPLSKHYLNLYNKDFKEKRMKCKPGLIPPFYSDLPKTLDEIIESERKYLEAYKEHPVATDVKYFVKCINNIFLKGARSA